MPDPNEVLYNNLCARHIFGITPSDTNNLLRTVRSIYIGGDGNVRLTSIEGDLVNFVGLKAGTILPVMTLKVWSTGTSATSLVGLV
jgi:hypothetical protein